MAIRPATEEDIEGIRQVATASWETDYPDVLSRETIHEGVEHWYSEPVIRMELQSPRTELLVAETDAAGLVGFVHGHWAGDAGIIMRLYVHPEHRGKGLGTQLFEAISSALRDRGVEQLRAMALAANETATAFFENQGMAQVGSETTAIAGEQYEEAIYEYRD
jgi:GNAT superfamily N-acetyltransferase